MFNEDAVTALVTLRRQGNRGPVLGVDAIADDAFVGLFAGQPEFARDHGFFTDGVYAVSSMIIDSANAQTLAFGPYKVTVGARRTLHLRFNDLTDPKPVPRDTDYASVFESDVPIMVQHTRLDSRRAEVALLSTMAYSEG
jgi:hypothetical protein